MTHRRLKFLALLAVVAAFGIVFGYLMGRDDPNSALRNQAFEAYKEGSPKAIPLLTELGARDDRTASEILASIYIEGDQEFGVKVDDNKGAFWLRRTDDEIGSEVYYAKAFLDG